MILEVIRLQSLITQLPRSYMSEFQIFECDSHIKFKIGQSAQQEFGMQVIKIIAFEPELIENVITQWEDEERKKCNGKIYRIAAFVRSGINCKKNKNENKYTA